MSRSYCNPAYSHTYNKEIFSKLLVFSVFENLILFRNVPCSWFYRRPGFLFFLGDSTQIAFRTTLLTRYNTFTFSLVHKHALYFYKGYSVTSPPWSLATNKFAPKKPSPPSSLLATNNLITLNHTPERLIRSTLLLCYIELTTQAEKKLLGVIIHIRNV